MVQNMARMIQNMAKTWQRRSKTWPKHDQEGPKHGQIGPGGGGGYNMTDPRFWTQTYKLIWGHWANLFGSKLVYVNRQILCQYTNTNDIAGQSARSRPGYWAPRDIELQGLWAPGTLSTMCLVAGCLMLPMSLWPNLGFLCVLHVCTFNCALCKSQVYLPFSQQGSYDGWINATGKKENKSFPCRQTHPPIIYWWGALSSKCVEKYWWTTWFLMKVSDY